MAWEDYKRPDGNFDWDKYTQGWPECPDCGQKMGMYAPPCPAAPRGALSHHCSKKGREVVTYPGEEGQSRELTQELDRFVGGSVATSRANAAALRDEDEEG